MKRAVKYCPDFPVIIPTNVFAVRRWDGSEHFKFEVDLVGTDVPCSEESRAAMTALLARAMASPNEWVEYPNG